MRATKEIAFEDAIEEWLLEHAGYTKGLRTNYDSSLALDTAELHTFMVTTQAEAWQRLVELHGGDPDIAQNRFVERLAKQIDERGGIDVLRHGVEDLGVEIRLAYFRPASGLNPELEARYQANRLTVVRQLVYAPGSANALDLVLFVNGIPIATAELKNQLTGQDVRHAMAQYREDRDPRDALFARRAVVHFAVDQDEVMMTPRLAGNATRFLPFNRGSDPGARECGKGNPPVLGGYRTSYLWEKVWQRDAWLDILHRFVHLEHAEAGRKGKGARRNGTLIFPRYHQWDAVRVLEDGARREGAGHNYLVEHSAGSGKSNTVGWLAHRLASLHDEGDTKVFDKVVVITDRLVLDKQLQDTIFQLEHAHGVVWKIDESSAQLAEALASAEAKIIVTTLQKFPFAMEKIAQLPERRYAVIIDEAHSSQTGETAQEMKRALAGLRALIPEGEGGEIDPEEAIAAAIEASARARGRHANMSMFAFTATPKGKTLELFGRQGDDGLHHPFHRYSMRQAIEEGFILDVLADYTTYSSYFRLARAGEEDPEVEVRRAAREVAKFASLHPAHFAQKAEIVVEHFRRITRTKIGGKAKAMVVCSSRLHAVRTRQAIDEYAREHGYGDVQALVAFSGTVRDPETGIEFTESRMNGFPESETVERFAGERPREHERCCSLSSDPYGILIVAEKFQTGFDQPLLHTMFVDKKLAGVNAVQTLSRLNRIHPDKDDTFVLDFVNTGEEIQASFAPYYGGTAGESTDANELWDAWNELDRFGVVRPADVDAFAREYFGGKPGDIGLQARLYSLLDVARERFTELSADEQEECRAWLKRFTSRYAFLSQVIPYTNTEMEKRYQYCRHLLRRLPARESGMIDLGDQVQLTHLRVRKTGEHDLRLEKGTGALKSFAVGAPGGWDETIAPLSEILARFNEAFGVNLTEADRLHLEGIASDMAADETMQQQAAVNTLDNFKLEFEKGFINAVAARLEQARDLTFKILDDKEFKTNVAEALLPRVYEQARVAYQKTCPAGELLTRGEDANLEFKSTLRWDLEKGEKSKLVETATVKTVAAFLNSRYGGTLLIGVADDSSVVGLEHDYGTLRKEGKADADRFQLHLNQLVENAVGIAAAANVTTQVHSVHGKQICRVHVEPSGHPVYADVTVARKAAHEKKPVFYIRLNNATRAIEQEEEIQRYIAARWGTATQVTGGPEGPPQDEL